VVLDSVTARLLWIGNPDPDRAARSASMHAGQWQKHEAIRPASQAAVAFGLHVHPKWAEIKGNYAIPHTRS
jgi:hypothetical protein